MTIGIYKITNKKTGQIYIGQSVNIEKRFKEHIQGHGCPYSYIDNAIQKYGKENFNFEIITQLPNNKKLLNTHEKYWIKFYNTYKDNFHYNLTIGGDGFSSGENHPMYGKHHSKETKKKISENHYCCSGENHPRYGKHHSEEAKKKMSKSKSGENHPMYGKHHSKETKKKISKANSGENNPAWKNYARIIKYGKVNNKQAYAIKYQGKIIKKSIFIDKLMKWFFENHPLEIIKTYKVK